MGDEEKIVEDISEGKSAKDVNSASLNEEVLKDLSQKSSETPGQSGDGSDGLSVNLVGEKSSAIQQVQSQSKTLPMETTPQTLRQPMGQQSNNKNPIQLSMSQSSVQSQSESQSESKSKPSVSTQSQYQPRGQTRQTISQDISALSDDDAILKFIKESEQKIYVIGTGGSGTNTLNRLFELGVDHVKLIAANTDARHLLRIKADKKIILGKQLTKGQGAGSNPQIGADATKETLAEIVNAVNDASLVFITCGLGGGTGTGSAPIIAEAVKKMGAMVVAIVTFPFTAEGRIRLENAMEGLENLKKHTDTLIIIKNDKLLTIAPDLPLNTAFKVCDEVLAGSLKGVVELVTKSGLVNVDFADLTTIIKDGGLGVIGMGEASLDAKRDDRARIALEIAMNSPMLDVDLGNATRALVNVVGGEDMSLKEAEYIVSETAKRIHPNAHIIWGARLEENMKKSAIRVLLVLTGVKFQKFETEINTEDLENLDLDLIG